MMLFGPTPMTHKAVIEDCVLFDESCDPATVHATEPQRWSREHRGPRGRALADTAELVWILSTRADASR